MAEVITIEDLQDAKKHEVFHAECITGRSGGVTGGAEINTATNPITGQVQTTFPKILADYVDTYGGTFTEGFTVQNRGQLFYFESGGQVTAYKWAGSPLALVVAAGTMPSDYGTIGTDWVDRTDVVLRSDLAGDEGSKLSGYRNSTVYDALERKIYADVFKLSAEADYTGAIQRGIQYCIDNNLSTLYFKSGIYLISDALGDCPVNFVSDGKTIIRNTNTATLGSVNGKSVIVFTQGITTIKGVVFDGQVSATANTYNQDPTSWSNSNYETWHGMQGPVVSAASGFSIIDSDAENFYRAGYYITGCSDFMVVRPKTNRNRGNFGDGIFIGNNCHNFTVIGSSARDFTRGGLVCDMGCYDFTIMGNSATHGHDWSALYGGTEYSAGLWIEKSTRALVSGGRLSNTGYFGAILSLEIDGFIPVSYREYMTLNISGTRIDGSVVGLNCRNANGAKGKVCATNVDSSVSSGNVAMLLRGFPGLTVEVIGGSATVTGATAGACIAVGSLGQDGVIPVYTLRGVGIGHTTPSGAADAKSRLATADVGDICLYTLSEYDFQLNIDDCYSLADPAEILISLRTARITPSWHNPSVWINAPKHPVYYVDSSLDAKPTFKATGVEFSNLKAYCRGFLIDNCVMKGASEIYFNSAWEFANNIARDTSFMAEHNKIHYVGAAPVYALTPVFMLDSCRFSGDLSAADSYLVDIRRVDVTGARVGWIQRDVLYTNFGGNGANAAAVSCQLGDYNLPAYKYSNVFDTLVTNVLRTSAGVVTDPTTVNIGVRENMVLSG